MVSTSFSFDHISDEALDFLSTLDYSDTGTRRLCFHESEKATLHVMLVEMKADVKYPFHEHPESDEFMLLIEGILVISFEDGSKFTLSKKGASSIIIPAHSKHAVASGPEGAQYIEVIKGPFRRQNHD